MDQSPLLLLLGKIQISRCCGDLAVTYAEKEISHANSRRRSSCWRSWSAVILQINKRNLKNPLKKYNTKPLKKILAYLSERIIKKS